MQLQQLTVVHHTDCVNQQEAMDYHQIEVEERRTAERSVVAAAVVVVAAVVAVAAAAFASVLLLWLAVGCSFAS